MSVVSEYVWVSVFMCSCASEPICTMSVVCACITRECVSMWVDVWTCALYQGSFCSLKSQ